MLQGTCNEKIESKFQINPFRHSSYTQTVVSTADNHISTRLLKSLGSRVIGFGAASLLDHNGELEICL
jgi:hypothetical protein